MQPTPIEQLDFEDYKNALKSYLKTQDRFKDYDYEGSNMSILLDILAYNTFQNSFYTNMVFSEMFMDSAQTRSAIVSHAKELNYLPSSIRSSKSKLDIELDVNDSPSFVTIPRYTKFSAKAGGKTFNFLTTETVSIIPQDGVYSFGGLPVLQGKLVREKFVATGDISQKFELSNDNIDISTLRLIVKSSLDTNSDNTEYVHMTTILGVSPEDNVFYLEPSLKENMYSVVFGRNKFGKSPSAGQFIEIEYLVTEGPDANGLKTFSANDRIAGYEVTSIIGSKSEGGALPEDNESIRFFAPKAVQVQDRAITASDYEVLLKTRFPMIESVSVFGGEDLSPPQYGKVMISVDVENTDGLSESLKTKFKKYLKDRAPLTIEPVIISPEFMYIDVSTTVYYDVKNTTLSVSDIKDKVKNEILKYSKEKLSDFGRTFRFSKFVNIIDGADANIVSNDTEVSAILKIAPVSDEISSFNLNFNGHLKDDHVLADYEEVTQHNAAIKSDVFEYNGADSFLMDDGLGAIHIFQNQGNKFVITKRLVGEVDYQTGKVLIKNLTVNSFSNDGIKIYGKYLNSSFDAPKSRILRIDSNDIKINVKVLDE